jgi:hypothetical protein
MCKHERGESMEYIIIRQTEGSVMERAVVEALGRGWELSGGVSVSIFRSEVFYAQAMVRAK